MYSSLADGKSISLSSSEWEKAHSETRGMPPPMHGSRICGALVQYGVPPPQFSVTTIEDPVGLLSSLDLDGITIEAARVRLGPFSDSMSDDGLPLEDFTGHRELCRVMRDSFADLESLENVSSEDEMYVGVEEFTRSTTQLAITPSAPPDFLPDPTASSSASGGPPLPPPDAEPPVDEPQPANADEARENWPILSGCGSYLGDALSAGACIVGDRLCDAVDYVAEFVARELPDREDCCCWAPRMHPSPADLGLEDKSSGTYNFCTNCCESVKGLWWDPNGEYEGVMLVPKMCPGCGRSWMSYWTGTYPCSWVKVQVGYEVAQKIGVLQELKNSNPKRDPDSVLASWADNANKWKTGDGNIGLWWKAHWRHVHRGRHVTPWIVGRIFQGAPLPTGWQRIKYYVNATTALYRKDEHLILEDDRITTRLGLRAQVKRGNSEVPAVLDVAISASLERTVKLVRILRRFELIAYETQEFGQPHGGKVPTLSFKIFTPVKCLQYNVSKTDVAAAVIADHQKFEFLANPPFDYTPPSDAVDAEMGFTLTDSKVYKTGPFLRPPVIWTTGSQVNKLSAVEGRSTSSVSADLNSATYQRFMEWHRHMMLYVWTVKNILRAWLVDPTWDSQAYGRYNQEDIWRATWSWLVDKQHAEDRTGFLKLETIFKDGKWPRQIQDEKLALFCVGQVLGKIFHEIVFGHGTIGEAASIKHRSKIERMNEIAQQSNRIAQLIKLLGGNPAACEVDQTAMELHTRCKWCKKTNRWIGNLAPIYEIMQRILEVMIDNPGDFPLFEGWAFTIEQLKEGVHFRIRPTGIKALEAGCQVITIRFEDLYTLSGGILTSGGNFYEEFGMSLSSMTRNPEVVCRPIVIENEPDVSDATGTQPLTDLQALAALHQRPAALHQPTQISLDAGLTSEPESIWFHARKFNWVFMCIGPPILDPKTQRHKPREFILRCWVEGDDFYAIIAGGLPFAEKYKKNFRALGMNAKLKFIVNGRGEFCGIHFLLKDGVPQENWIPDFARNLGKISCTICPDGFDIMRVISRYASFALMFKDRELAAFQLMRGLFHSWYKEFIDHYEEYRQRDANISVSLYEHAGLRGVDGATNCDIRGNFKVPLKNVVAAIDASDGDVTYPSFAEAAALLSTSLESYISEDEYVKMLHGFADVTRFTVGEDLLPFLPQALLDVLPLPDPK